MSRRKKYIATVVTVATPWEGDRHWFAAIPLAKTAKIYDLGLFQHEDNESWTLAAGCFVLDGDISPERHNEFTCLVEACMNGGRTPEALGDFAWAKLQKLLKPQ